MEVLLWVQTQLVINKTISCTQLFIKWMSETTLKTKQWRS